MAKPFLKYVGGKRLLVPELGPVIGTKLSETKGCYIEPFLGGGAMALYLGPHDMVLADGSARLVAMYQTIQRCDPAEIRETLNDLGKCIGEDAYYSVREAFNAGIEDPIEHAAAFIYLNKTGFNGLYRENSDGGYNVPYGKPANRTGSLFPSLHDLKLVKAALQGSVICGWDFEALIEGAEEGDVLYVDPPYDGGFSQYIAAGFSTEDQIRLARALERASLRGVTIIAHNANTELILGLYQWATVTALDEKRPIAAAPEARQDAPCVIITAAL